MPFVLHCIQDVRIWLRAADPILHPGAGYYQPLQPVCVVDLQQ
jgi:hypothetical protein